MSRDTAKTPCAGGNHFAVCLPLRVVRPMVGTDIFHSHREADKKARSARPAHSGSGVFHE